MHHATYMYSMVYGHWHWLTDASLYMLQLYKDILGPYWTEGRDRVEEHYRSYSLPFPGWRR